ncbi:MAG TPA: 2-C-methyl-D-erythritol 4-phosphate cytidylyltransferase [Bacillales bacterium]|nr:2-C-methyl-D-erythritol 4-phosphate cytidylyltransferase [Bacillales bacterium]
MNYTVVIPAAGAGKRMNAGKNKLLLELGGKPLLIHTLSVFERDDRCEGMVLVVHSDEMQQMGHLLSRYRITKARHRVIGGAERQDSVYHGLQACGDAGIVLIHDGARPFISQHIIHRLVQRAGEGGAAIPAVPVKDTIKKVDGGVVKQTLERSSLWAVQTPQAFRLPLVKKAHEKARRSGVAATDDAALVEHAGHPVSVVESEYDNIKITTPEDLAAARAILTRREGER